MTIFAVVCAGLYPILHLGRPWVFYWLVPYPNTFGLFPQFRSPLDWDFFAIGTYFTISLIFWFIGLIPDLASLRDNARNGFQRLLYGVLSLGWNGSTKAWQRYQRAYSCWPRQLPARAQRAPPSPSTSWRRCPVEQYHHAAYCGGRRVAGFAMVLILGALAQGAQVRAPHHASAPDNAASSCSPQALSWCTATSSRSSSPGTGVEASGTRSEPHVRAAR